MEAKPAGASIMMMWLEFLIWVATLNCQFSVLLFELSSFEY